MVKEGGTAPTFADFFWGGVTAYLAWGITMTGWSVRVQCEYTSGGNTLVKDALYGPGVIEDAAFLGTQPDTARVRLRHESADCVSAWTGWNGISG